jgi:hypothetical protein
MARSSEKTLSKHIHPVIASTENASKFRRRRFTVVSVVLRAPMRKLSLLAVVMLIGACGGSTTPTPNTGTNGTPDAAATSTATAAVEDAGPPKPTVESQRDPFVQACMAKLTAPEYCNCAFDQFRDVFKDADLSVKPSEAQLATVKQRTLSTCATKLPEESVKSSFTTTCVSGESRKAPYCECAWTALRKKLPVADFVGEFEGPRFDEAKKGMSVACKGKLPEDLVKAEFLGGCTKAAPTQAKTCDCAWKKLRAKGSPEEIAAGLVEVKPEEVAACKKSNP